MAKWSDEKMADLTRKLADTAIDYKKRCEELEARLSDPANAIWDKWKDKWHGEKKFALREVVKYLRGEKDV
jgi:hypothetical protein